MAEQDTLILGTRKGTIILKRRGGSWNVTRHSHHGIPVPYAFVDVRTGLLWASQNHGHWSQKLVRSSDMGEQWTEIEAPKYPEGSEIKDGQPATTGLLWMIAPGASDEPNRLYFGTEPGGLFETHDGGESFQLNMGLWDHPSRKEQWFGGGLDHPAIHSVWIDPRNSKRVLVGISCAGVFETLDDGKSWAPQNRGLKADFLPDPNAEVGQDPHFLMACATQPDKLWQQNHCGIFRSVDGARSWEKVSQEGGPAHFGFAIAVDPSDGDIAWVVPAVSDEVRMAVNGALCVCRTEDGGKTWTAQRTGLPQEQCYDVTFRHALDLSGDSLAFGTTTGNLFLSDDRGDSWTSLGHNFPPVYSVRFAPSS